MKNIHAFFTTIILLIVFLVAPISVLANEQVSFTGTVMTVQGQRLEIELLDGSRIWATMEQLIPESAIGKLISGSYLTLGDTYLLVDPNINKNSQ